MARRRQHHSALELVEAGRGRSEVCGDFGVTRCYARGPSRQQRQTKKFGKHTTAAGPPRHGAGSANSPGHSDQRRLAVLLKRDVDINSLVSGIHVDINGPMCRVKIIIDINGLVSGIDVDINGFVSGIDVDINGFVSDVDINGLVSGIDVDINGLVSGIDVDINGLVSGIDVDINGLVSGIDVDINGLVSGIDVDINGLVSGIDVDINGLVSGIDVDINSLESDVDIDGLVSGIDVDINGFVSGIDVDINGLVSGIDVDINGLVSGIDLDINGHVSGINLDINGHVSGIDVDINSLVSDLSMAKMALSIFLIHGRRLFRLGMPVRELWLIITQVTKRAAVNLDSSPATRKLYGPCSCRTTICADQPNVFQAFVEVRPLTTNPVSNETRDELLKTKLQVQFVSHSLPPDPPKQKLRVTVLQVEVSVLLERVLVLPENTTGNGALPHKLSLLGRSSVLCLE
ncbi:hypothetical protein RRG08_001667 [Elysia crispata]|uniref:Uncharacterized protein n=1 Tax=Elysia crispata TaxID=231223 RepID=A0AAE1AK91_9GAST|nr:hypothetical protein RRG08_001667 [Elysia crispata]